MRFSTAAIFSAILGAAAVSAETFTVLVGKDAGLTYEPSTVVAKKGDIINFQFLSKNHTVTQSTFTSPCVAKSEGVDSGFQFIPAGVAQKATWSITINNDTAPLWFFCNQGAHCKAGMVFAVNPSAAKTFDAFKASAAAGGGAISGPNAATAASANSGASSYGSSYGGSYGDSSSPGPAAGGAGAGAGSGSESSALPDSEAAQQTTAPGAALSSRGVSWMGAAGAMVVAAFLL